MKKYALLIVVSALLLGTNLVAQSEVRPPQKRESRQGDRMPVSPEVRAEQLAKTLQLADSVKLKVKELFVVQDQKAKEFRAGLNSQSPDSRDKMREYRKAEMDELKAVIGAEKFEQYMKDRKDRMPQRQNN